MGERNFSIDLVDLFANIVDGEFFEGVHHFSHGPGGSLSAFGGLLLLPGLSFYAPKAYSISP